MRISPDTKDWTWVLERPCDQCGFDSSSYAREDIAGSIRSSAASWADQLGRDGVAVRTVPDKWSVLEYGCHVRDAFGVFTTRLELMLAEDGPTFENWDQDVTATEARYDRQNPMDVAVQLTDAATVLANRFDEVADGQWDRSGTRSNGSHFTVESLGLYLIHDPIHHLWDVSLHSS